MSKILFTILKALSGWLSRLVPAGLGRITDNQAEATLAGKYTEKALWEQLPPLQPDTMDASIVIPVYNSERFLEKCLSSILEQKTTYSYEVICINDGSRDASLQILKQLQSRYPDKLVIYSQENQGISAARNQGIALAKGKYIGFIDNDDYVTDDYVQRILDRALTTDADIVQVGHIRISPEGKQLAQRHQEQDLSIQPGDQASRLSYIYGYIWGGMLRKELFAKVRFPKGFWYEDIITRLVMMRLAQRIECIKECLYYYLVHGTNASKTVWKAKGYKYLDQFYLAKALAEYADTELGLPKDELLYGVLTSEYGTILWLRTRTMGISLQKAIFTKAARYMASIRPQGYQTSDCNAQKFDEFLRTNNFWGWYLYSLSCMCGVKLRNNADV